jgi:transcriptional regulator with XRE-family HTH domain
MILRIKEVMKQKGVGRDELAEAVGVSTTTISNINSEKNYPSFPLLIQIANKLDVDVRELLVSTKVNSINQSDLDGAKELIKAGLEKLG